MLVFTREHKCDLILLTVEDLAKVARQVSHDDAETFEELSIKTGYTILSKIRYF